jgi:hypothetical protein
MVATINDKRCRCLMKMKVRLNERGVNMAEANLNYNNITMIFMFDIVSFGYHYNNYYNYYHSPEYHDDIFAQLLSICLYLFKTNSLINLSKKG